MTWIQYAGSISPYHLTLLTKLIGSQSEQGMTSRHRRTFITNEILHPILEALNKKYPDGFENIDVPLNSLIRDAILNEGSRPKEAATVKQHESIPTD